MTPIFPRRGLGNLRGLARLAADRSGNVAIIYALMAVVLMLAIGAAVDISRWLHARDQTLAAVDSAVLAGGRYLQTNGIDGGAEDPRPQGFRQRPHQHRRLGRPEQVHLQGGDRAVLGGHPAVDDHGPQHRARHEPAVDKKHYHRVGQKPDDHDLLSLRLRR